MIDVGDKVSYPTIGAGTIKGIVVKVERDLFYDGYYATVRVTSRRNPVYPAGYRIYAPVSMLRQR